MPASRRPDWSPRARRSRSHHPGTSPSRSAAKHRSPAHHRGLAARTEDVVLAIQHDLHVERQISGARHDPPLRSTAALGPSPAEGALGTEPRQVSGRHRFVDLAVGDETVLHADGLQDVGFDPGLKVLSADDLDQTTEDLVVCVRVFPSGVGQICRSDLCQRPSARSPNASTATTLRGPAGRRMAQLETVFASGGASGKSSRSKVNDDLYGR